MTHPLAESTCSSASQTPVHSAVPTQNRGVRRRNSALRHHLDQIPRVQFESQIPAHAKYDDLPVEMPSLKQIQCSHLTIIPRDSNRSESLHQNPKADLSKAQKDEADYRLRILGCGQAGVEPVGGKGVFRGYRRRCRFRRELSITLTSLLHINRGFTSRIGLIMGPFTSDSQRECSETKKAKIVPFPGSSHQLALSPR